MSDAPLVQIGQPANAIQGGMGLNFGTSKLYDLKPATVTINQSNTQTEGAIPGKLRITDTGEQFDSMIVALLDAQESRDYYVGEAGQLNRSPENLMCFARGTDGNPVVAPHQNAKVPQAMRCASCPKADWSKWRQTNRPEDKPPCDKYYKALFIDTVYQLPFNMYIRSLQKGTFEQGVQELMRKLRLMRSQGKNPNIFDIRFRLSTKRVVKGKYPSFVPVMSDFKVLTDEERVTFGGIYRDLTQGRRQVGTDAVAQTSAVIDAEVVEPGTTDVVEGEIII